MNDSLGDRIKSNYEDRARYYLPRRTNLIIRVDGKAFHTFTRHCKKPFDQDLIDCMNATAVYLCKKIQGAKFAYVQSDEISILVTDYDSLETCAWFDNNIQKIVSVSASIATTAFNKEWIYRLLNNDWDSDSTVKRFEEATFAEFDARTFTIPETSEVANYFLWRAQDATRNSIQMLARSLYSHKELDGVKTDDLKIMCNEASTPWENLDCSLRHGRIIIPFSGDWAVAGLPENTFKYWNESMVKPSTTFPEPDKTN